MASATHPPRWAQLLANSLIPNDEILTAFFRAVEQQRGEEDV